MQVIKSSGDLEKFDPRKIRRTIREAGGSRTLALEAVRGVKKKYHENLPTKEILFFLLKFLEREPGVSERYNLKRAIMSLGPSGFPFEKFFARLLDYYGFKTTTENRIKGKKIYHEVDVVAVKDKKWMIECKYHNETGIITKLHPALSTYARFLDVKHNKFDSPWLSTNTKCSVDAINYAKSVGMRITSWKYPEKDNLQKLIQEKKLYPITILKSLSENVLNEIYNLKIVIAKDLLKFSSKELASKIGLSEKDASKVLEEVKTVCS